MRALATLPPRDERGHVLCVVESPRGSRVKLKLDPKLGVMTLGRALPLGLHYPFDFGFVPGTRAEDGDPIDVMLLHDAETLPGVVIPSRLLGVVKAEQTQRGRIARNDRLLAAALESPRFDGLRDARKLPKRTRDELVAFFLAAVAFTEKKVRILGWGGPREAEKLLRESELAR